MTYSNNIFSLFLILGAFQYLFAQGGYVFENEIRQEKIFFESHSNLIILPVKVNDVALNFILDTGATKTIIFNLNGVDSLNIKQGKYIKVNGYGEKKSVMAYYSSGNKVEVGKHVKDSNAEVVVLSDSEIDMSPKIDIEVHGLLSVDFLKNFIVHIDYIGSYIELYDNINDLPRFLRNATTFDLNVKGGRPFVNVQLDNNLVKGDYELLLDTGSGDALWILNEMDEDVVLKNSFEDYLGFGINGEIYGLRTKVRTLKLFDNTFEKVAVSYPYKKYHSTTSITSNDGNLGGEILRRFDVVIDLTNKKLSMIPNKNFDEGFYYNMSGLGVKKGKMELFTTVTRNFSKAESTVLRQSASVNTVNYNAKLGYKYVPQIFIDYVREGSPGDIAGIKIGDQIISINNYTTSELTMGRVIELFYKNPYKKLKIKLKRGRKEFKVEIINIPLVL
jgi:hypothetical protein